MGYLLTVGNKTIKDNLLHKDNWYNFEFKLKGTRNKKSRDLDWSFRVGTRIHSNKEFVNTIYVGARRSSIDYKKTVWSLKYNSAFNVLFGVSDKSFKLTEIELLVEKKWPSEIIEKSSFGLVIGYIYNSGEKYRGSLKDEGIDNHQFILRPNFKF